MEYIQKSNSDAQIKTWTEKDSNGDEQYYVESPISSTSTDRDGDAFSTRGLQNMREQINSGSVPLFMDHGSDGNPANRYSVRDIAGAWEKATLDGDTLVGKARLSEKNDAAQDLKDLIDEDLPVSFSVGFKVIDYDDKTDTGGFIFHEVDLMEVSAVGIGSNADATLPTARSAPEGITAKSVSVATETLANGDEPDYKELEQVEEASDALETIERVVSKKFEKANSKYNPSQRLRIQSAKGWREPHEENQEAVETLREFVDNSPKADVTDDVKEAFDHLETKLRPPEKDLTMRIHHRAAWEGSFAQELDSAFKDIDNLLTPDSAPVWDL